MRKQCPAVYAHALPSYALYCILIYLQMEDDANCCRMALVVAVSDMATDLQTVLRLLQVLVGDL